MEMPIRVAHIIGKWFGGGVESVVMNYYRHIDRNKIQFDFICDDDSTDIPYDEIRSLGGEIILVPPYQRVISYQKELIKVFGNKKYKIVHSHINTLSIYPLRAAKKAGIPIRIAHSHSTSNRKEWEKNLLKNILRPFSRVYATNYMCCSELAGRWLFGNKIYDAGEVDLLNNAIDVNKFIYNQGVRNNKRKELNINGDILVVGHVGRFVTQKNHKFLIDIFNELHKQNSNSVLLLIGQGPLKLEIQEKVNSLNLKDSVKFIGQRSDVNELYQAFDVFLFPSLYEGLGMAVIEAQYAKVPCFCSTHIPNNANISTYCYFSSLNNSAKKWADNILDTVNLDRRNASDYRLTNFDYDIKNNAYYLERMYMTYLNKFLNLFNV